MVAAEGTILVDPEDGDMGAYLASLERLRGLGLRWLLPSHGRVIHDADGVLAYYLAHRRAREARILAAIGDAWTTTDALLPATYGDVDRALWPIATRSLVAHLVHLHRRGAAERGRRTSGGGAAVEPVAAEAPSVGDACWRRAAIAAATES
jgi:ribonuclease/clavin/mitogillin